MTLELWLAFVAASALLLVIPGPTILTVISYAMTNGARARLPLVAAVALGDSTALAMSLLGLGALLATSALWFTTIKWVGGITLVWLGLKLLRADGGRPAMSASSAPDARWRVFANTYLVTALNPKGLVFFVAFLPQFVNSHADVARQLWILAASFVALAILNATCYAVFASAAHRMLAAPHLQRRFNIAGGALLSAAGVWALLARRPA
jgi:threonine/homoserine/homoserine lactone efflux protein